MKYIYPPRPETKVAPESLDTFDNMDVYFAQPKLNGSSMEIYFSDGGKEIKLMNRHKEPIACKLDKEEIRKLYSGTGEMILCGEYMNKNQRDGNGKYWNIKYVIWDILVYNGKHLLASSFEERFNLLISLYPDNLTQPHLHKISENCYRVDTQYYGFKKFFNYITKFEMYEGLVMKRRDGKLENGTTATNNTRTQIKCRKPTKNYNF